MIRDSKLAKEFRDFVARGNVIDMSVGIIMGAAFTTISKSLVDDIIMPVIGVMTSDVNFSTLFINLNEGHYKTLAEAKAAGAATLNYGMFINAILNFVIVAIATFFLVKAVSKLKKKAQEQAPAPKTDPEELMILREIRDLLKK